MIGIGKALTLTAVATSGTAGGIVGWGLGKGPKYIELDSSGIWCKATDLNSNPSACFKYDTNTKSWSYGQISSDGNWTWNEVEGGKVFLW